MVHQVPGKPSLLLNLKQDKGKLEKHAKELSIHLLEDWKELQEDDVQVSSSPSFDKLALMLPKMRKTLKKLSGVFLQKDLQ